MLCSPSSDAFIHNAEQAWKAIHPGTRKRRRAAPEAIQETAMGLKCQRLIHFLKPDIRGINPSKPMMHIAYFPYFQEIYKFPSNFCIIYTFPPLPLNLRLFA